MSRASYGQQKACKLCGFDIEFHGKATGWIDRGSNRFCRGSKWDEDGIPVPFPHVLHKPYLQNGA